MRYPSDPIRLRELGEDIDDALASALDDLAGEEPSAADLLSLRASLSLALGSGPLAPVDSSGAASTAGSAASVVKGGMTLAKWTSLVIAPMGVGAIAGAVVIGVAVSGRTVPGA